MDDNEEMKAKLKQFREQRSEKVEGKTIPSRRDVLGKTVPKESKPSNPPRKPIESSTTNEEESLQKKQMELIQWKFINAKIEAHNQEFEKAAKQRLQKAFEECRKRQAEYFQVEEQKLENELERMVELCLSHIPMLEKMINSLDEIKEPLDEVLKRLDLAQRLVPHYSVKCLDPSSQPFSMLY